MIRTFIPALFAMALLCAPAAAQNVPPAISAAVADAGRPANDKALDANRKPGRNSKS